MTANRSRKSIDSLQQTCLHSEEDSLDGYSAIGSPSINLAYQSSSSPFGARKKFRTKSKSEDSPTGSAHSERYKPTPQLPSKAQLAAAQTLAAKQSPNASPIILMYV